MVTALEDRSVPSVVYSNTFNWNGVATVVETVTDDNPSYPGQYYWNYNVTNLSLTSGLGTFALPAEDVSMVANVGSSLNWIIEVGTAWNHPDIVAWRGVSRVSPPLSIGQSANFWFTTAPADFAITSGVVADLNGVNLDLNTLPAGFCAAPIPYREAPMPAILVTTDIDKDTPNVGITSLRQAIDWVNQQNTPAQQFEVRFSSYFNDPGNRLIFLNMGQLPLITSNIFINGLDVNGVARDITILRPDVPDEFRLLEGDGDSTIKIAGLTLTNGGGDNFDEDGGAIRALGTLTLQNCTIQSNKASRGAGVYAVTLTIKNCTITENESSGSGGGVYATGTLVLEGGKLDRNKAMIGNGGGIYALGASVDIKGTKIDNNEAKGTAQSTGLGGGIYLANTVVLVRIKEGAEIFANTAQRRGGGVYIAGSAEGGTTVTMENCQVYWNTAESGAGVAIRKGTLEILSTSITDNGVIGVTNYGGGVYIDDQVAEVNFKDSTVSGNRASVSGGGIWVESPQTGVDPLIILDNTWVLGNTAAIAGAGIGVAAGLTTDGNPHLVLKGNTLIAYNTLTDPGSTGGGLYLGRGSIMFDGVTFDSNGAGFATGFYIAPGVTVNGWPNGATINNDSWWIGP